LVVLGAVEDAIDLHDAVVILGELLALGAGVLDHGVGQIDVFAGDLDPHRASSLGLWSRGRSGRSGVGFASPASASGAGIIASGRFPPKPGPGAAGAVGPFSPSTRCESGTSTPPLPTNRRA